MNNLYGFKERSWDFFQPEHDNRKTATPTEQIQQQ